MKNMLKRTLSLTLSVLMLMAILTACGEAPVLMSFMGEISSDIDYDGTEFVLADMLSSEDESLMSYVANTNLYDLALQRFSDVEKAFNCKIERKYISNDSKDLMQDIVGAARQYDILYIWHEPGQLLAGGRTLVPVYEYRHVIDLSNVEKYGTPSVQEANAYKGEIYLVSPQSWLYQQPAALDVIVFNMEHVERYGKADPREFLEDQKWNWDALETVVSDYYYKEGDKTIYSLACRCFDMLKLLCLSNGVSFTYRDETGALKSDLGQANMLEAVNFYNKLFIENKDKLALKASGEIDWSHMMDSFITQQNSMACLNTATFVYGTVAYKIENYAVMPFPSGPQGEYGKWPAIIEGIDGFAVPINSRDKEASFRIIDAICEPLEGFETESSRISFLAENVVFNEFDATVALTAHKNGSYSYWKADVGSFGPDLFWRKLSENPNTEKTARVLGQYEDKYNMSIEEYMTPNLELTKYFE